MFSILEFANDLNDDKNARKFSNCEPKYKQRPNKETSWQMSSFDSCCLTVAYFLLKI